ncbi:hypothetical protein MAHJHV35_47690 [Mycobacterium avium subsp. hominissuis]
MAHTDLPPKRSDAMLPSTSPAKREVASSRVVYESGLIRMPGVS